MNLLLDYQEKILYCLKKLKQKKIISFDDELKNFIVEIPPKSYNADISCNAAMILAKINNKSPSDLAEILKKNYGSTKNQQYRYNIEFVSANPTGPLHVGHCRGAILGDVLSNLLKFNGHLVTKEYYVNDYGNQIKTFVLSVYYRILEITEGKAFPSDKNLYPGNYIIDIAKKIIKEKKIK